MIRLRPEAPIEFVAGREAEITAELKFFCQGGRKIGQPTLRLAADDGSFKVLVPVPGSAMSTDLNLSIGALPEEIHSEFRESQQVVYDHSVSRRQAR